MTERPTTWLGFERHVADLFRRTGAYEVQHDYRVGGAQVDVLVTEETSTRRRVITVVDCKYYERAVGVERVRKFELLSRPLLSTGRADRALMVSAKGFTKEAKSEARDLGIVLWEVKDLEALAESSSSASISLDLQRLLLDAANGCRAIREQLRASEPPSTFDIEGIHQDLAKMLDEIGGVLTLYPLTGPLSPGQRRVRHLASRVEDQLERVLDAATYWTRIARELDAGADDFPSEQASADRTSARLMLFREHEQARQHLRNRLRAVEESCARISIEPAFESGA
ncbi:restriction endonuclease [Nocardioides halotolerans]|uniref:restriction endonuclease n=1 Tax=Nocardioides halotolerans TaxID=433660 RepID=UPI0004217DA7|nr:restriction endonuclease [Nocardioides halotolerans]